ncbi:MAG: hypothetical protein ACKVII_08575 [Planctomycetales bacterium]|jgi:hypothetical protein
MTIRCECDHCGASLKVKDKLGGTERKCPQCQEKIRIPDAPSDDSEETLLGGDERQSSNPDAPKKSAEEAEEDAIFGDDFFSLKEPESRPRYVPPVITDDDEEDEPAPRKKSKPKSSETEVGAEVESGSGANAASIASSLLSKSGKRNRPEDFKDPAEPEKVSYDFSEVKYLLVQRGIPAAVAAVVLFFLVNWMFSDMAGGSELPELAELTGRVTNNGEGVAGSLRFFPQAGTSGDGGSSGSSSFAFAGADGTYEVFYDDDNEGLVLGKHEVEIMVGTVRVTREITIEAGSHDIDFEIAE